MSNFDFVERVGQYDVYDITYSLDLDGLLKEWNRDLEEEYKISLETAKEIISEFVSNGYHALDKFSTEVFNPFEFIDWIWDFCYEYDRDLVDFDVEESSIISFSEL